MLKSGAPYGRVERLPARRVQASTKPPAGAREGEVCERRKSDLIGSQREQQVGDAVARGQVGIRDLHAVAVDATAARAHQHRASLTDDPGTELRALNDQSGSPLKLARVV